MKQSNLVLGIGILVAAILIIGSLFFSTGSPQESRSTGKTETVSTINQSIKNIALIPLQVITSKFSKFP